MSAAADGHPTIPTLRRPGRHAVVIGHRGASADVPENTLPAFEAAWTAGAPWVEADTQPTADGVPVILHDDDLDRTTSGTGPVRHHTYADVSGLAIIGGAGSGVPSLASLLALMPAACGLLLEIKGDHSRADVAEILRLCEASRHDDRVFLQSFEVSVLGHLRDLVPDRPRGLLVERLDDDPLARCRELGVAAYNPPYREVLRHPEVVNELRAAGIIVAVWTCDDPAAWADLTDAGVDAIITNTPAELVAWQAA
jgi:glycerophosphoryl diester phosphodiesterase